MDEQQSTAEREQWERWMAEARELGQPHKDLRQGVLTDYVIDGRKSDLHYSWFFDEFYLTVPWQGGIMWVGSTVDALLHNIGRLDRVGAILPSKVDDR